MIDEVMSFSNAISTSKTVLLILPLNTHDMQPVSMVIEFFKRRFRSEDITVVSTGHPIDILRALPRSQFIHIVQGEIGFLFMPRKELMRRIKGRPHDLAIDLNLDFLLPSGYICKASGARVRIGFADQRADIFYNLQVKADPTLARKQVYTRLATCLEKF
jgi:ADP-heptose:LPS heptosyltransferase